MDMSNEVQSPMEMLAQVWKPVSSIILWEQLSVQLRGQQKGKQFTYGLGSDKCSCVSVKTCEP